MKVRILPVLLCVVLLIAMCGCGGSNDDNTASHPENTAYRNVKVIGISGNATLTRASKQQAVYEQMLINGDDNIVTEAESHVDLLLDSDKYARIYENSDVTFKLEGDTSNGAIRIYLNKGGINSKIENKLSEKDSYEVHTPDAVMAVRGTEFEVKVRYTENGRQTEITTTSGSVEITLPDGEQRVNEAGNTTVVETGLDADGNAVDTQFKNSEADSDKDNDNDTTSSSTESTSSTPNVTAEICSNCKRELKNNQSHVLNCGAKHYSCDENDHSSCNECQGHVCDSATHSPLDCSKHYRCASGANEKVEHSMYCVVCKVYACESQKTHTWADCGCVTCVGNLGQDHAQCGICGRCVTGNKEHNKECGLCYSCLGDGENHGDGICNTGPQFSTSSN